ncbi:succinylglutamate desuccinylase/aspartoacylase family protein [Ancylobacter mangrovi]|uniref:succinylglutamate desuccinylase/aspartoacylase family protein n=1 Tax=Ancylobacter mangrovi TaxID=2972472 RepID=UPI00216329DC|nr:succinylglutamate desuccinylase/aspartoacylase family protein [Ancylobacter mangrovi]MCS0504627.1 succinylglutamate desuccinylase/aspartoacylase family protein [Ancylobacter mangrovi]
MDDQMDDVMEDLTIEGFTVGPGQRLKTRIPALELADGTLISLPLILINGVRPGPRIYIGAGIHGDEVNSVALVTKALAAVDPGDLAGSIVCVPVQQPLALQADHRLPLAQYLKSPLDQVPADAWTCFPGDANGNIAQVMAARLFGLITQCDVALDVHTPTRGGKYVPIAILPHHGMGTHAKRAEQLAHELGTGWIVRGERGMYVSDGILCVEATRAGVPCFTFEIGEGGRLDLDFVETGAQCVLNLLKGLGMIPGARVEPKVTHVMRDFVGIRATHGGVLVTEVELGQAVSRGERLCRIFDVFGDVVEEVVAPVDGLFVRATTLGTVSRGERVATLGVV